MFEHLISFPTFMQNISEINSRIAVSLDFYQYTSYINETL